MLVIKQINNNAAIAKDTSGTEVVVLGSGIGFPKIPYEITDFSKIERTFYDVNSQYFDMIGSLPRNIVMASADIVEQAEINLDCEFNTNLPFTLADHISFAIQRMNKGIAITTPIAYDVCHLYPLQFEIGQLALDIVQDYTKERLPEIEAINIALHLITAQAESGDMHEVIQSVEIISNIRQIIEEDLMVTIDEESYHYSRFVMHLRYLIKRLSEGNAIARSSSMLKTMRTEYPRAYHCVLKIVNFFKEEWHWTCDDEEELYLLMHVTRLASKIE